MILNFEFRKGILFIRIKGRLKHNDYRILSAKLDELIDKKGIKYFVINLNELKKCNVRVLSIFNQKYERIKLNCGRLLLCDSRLQSEVIYGRIHGIESINNELLAFKMIKL